LENILPQSRHVSFRIAGLRILSIVNGLLRCLMLEDRN
jgi:hypothetical protein